MNQDDHLAIELNVWERLTLIHIIKGQQTNIGTMLMLVEMLGQLELTDEEKEQVQYQETPVGPQWQIGVIDNLVLELPEKKVRIFAKMLNNYDGYRVADHQRVMTLYQKFTQQAENTPDLSHILS